MNTQRKSKTTKPQAYSLFEIMNGKRYHSAIMPSEGDPFDAFTEVRRSEGNYKLSLIEIRNGERREVVAAQLEALVVEDSEYEFAEDEYDD